MPDAAALFDDWDESPVSMPGLDDLSQSESDIEPFDSWAILQDSVPGSMAIIKSRNRVRRVFVQDHFSERVQAFIDGRPH